MCMIDQISTYDAAKWMARLAATDGAISPAERKVLSEFADAFGIDLSEQFNRYHFHAKDRGVDLFIALGVGGTPSAPEEFFIIPGRMVKLDKKIDRTRFIKCLCSQSPEALHNYIEHYYHKRVFK